jgi:hypothetical protein
MTAPGGEAATAWLSQTMWWYSATVLEPARALRRAGVPVVPSGSGDVLAPAPQPGLGPRFCREWRVPRLLDAATEHDHLVAGFDDMADVYDASCVRSPPRSSRRRCTSSFRCFRRTPGCSTPAVAPAGS